MTIVPSPRHGLSAILARTAAISSLAIALGMIVAIPTAHRSDAATYCQAVCQDPSSSACTERCNGPDQQKPKKKKIVIIPPPTVEPPVVVKSVKAPDWTISVFDPKGGGGNGGGGGGGNGR